MANAEIITYKHVGRVRELLGEAAIELIKRGDRHDKSKFTPEELGPLQEMQDLTDREGPAPYGSDEYKRRLEILKPMLDHHYEENSHHPEFYPNGIRGMDLYDIMEMSRDWIAAAERGGETLINLTASKERFNIGEELIDILKNTYDRLGYKHQ